MSDKASIRVEQMVELSVRQIAEAFCSMDDDAQARFFVECAAIADGWAGGGATWQWFQIGKHLATCSCATDDGREMVRSIAAAMELDWSEERKRVLDLQPGEAAS